VESTGENEIERDKKHNVRRYSDGDLHNEDVPSYLNTEDKQVVKEFINNVVRSQNTTVRSVANRDLGQIYLKTPKSNEGSLLGLF